MKFHAVMHSFQPVKIEGRVVLAKCNCCSTPRWAVYLSLRKSREFYYHGLSEEEAERTFNFLVQKRSQVKQGEGNKHECRFC